MTTLKPTDFKQYLDVYFLGHIYPKDLCPKFNIDTSNHSRRIKRAIALELCLSDGTPITSDLYKKEKLRQDSMQALDILKKQPDLTSRAGYAASYKQVSGQKRGRWSSAEEVILITGRHLNQTYSEILDKLSHRTINQLISKYHYLTKKEKIPKLCSSQNA